MAYVVKETEIECLWCHEVATVQTLTCGCIIVSSSNHKTGCLGVGINFFNKRRRTCGQKEKNLALHKYSRGEAYA